MPRPPSNCAPQSSHPNACDQEPLHRHLPLPPGPHPFTPGDPSRQHPALSGSWAPLAFGAPGRWPRKDRAAVLGLLPGHLVPSHSRAARRRGRAEGQASSCPCWETSQGSWAFLRLGDLCLTGSERSAWDRRESGPSPRAPGGLRFPWEPLDEGLGVVGGRSPQTPRAGPSLAGGPPGHAQGLLLRASPMSEPPV